MRPTATVGRCGHRCGMELIQLLVTLMTVATLVQCWQTTYNNDVSKPLKNHHLAKKFYQKSAFYYAKQATAAPPDAYYYNQRQAMLWGQRWQRHPVALPRRSYGPPTVAMAPGKPPKLPPAHSPKPVQPKPVVVASPSIIRETPVAAPSNRSPTAAREQSAVDWSSPEMLQQPEIDEERRTDRQLGDACTYSRDCTSGCCLLERTTKRRSCQPRASFAERCSKAQVKGDLYADACPCASGVDYCSSLSSLCSA